MVTTFQKVSRLKEEPSWIEQKTIIIKDEENKIASISRQIALKKNEIIIQPNSNQRYEHPWRHLSPKNNIKRNNTLKPIKTELNKPSKLEIFKRFQEKKSLFKAIVGTNPVISIATSKRVSWRTIKLFLG